MSASRVETTMVVAQLRASASFAGAEQQMIGLATALRGRCALPFLLFDEAGGYRAFHERLRDRELDVQVLEHDTPRALTAVRELAGQLRRLEADVLCCHGYKADILGWRAARRAGIPVVAVAHGWTGEGRKVRAYEALDRLVLRRMDLVICVSEGQARKVRACGVRPGRVAVVHNAVGPEAFAPPDPAYRRKLEAFFPWPKDRIVCAAGRLSPEKGFDVLVAAAARLAREESGVGFILFGEGPLRGALADRIAAEDLGGSFVLAGFRRDFARFLPCADLAVLPSYTEGLPCVVLEALAAGVPVVATAVGGTPEVLEDGVGGFLVPAGDPEALAGRIRDALDPSAREAMGRRGRRRVRDGFTFETQAPKYEAIFASLIVPRPDSDARRVGLAEPARGRRR